RAPRPPPAAPRLTARSLSTLLAREHLRGPRPPGGVAKAHPDLVSRRHGAGARGHAPLWASGGGRPRGALDLLPDPRALAADPRAGVLGGEVRPVPRRCVFPPPAH